MRERHKPLLDAIAQLGQLDLSPANYFGELVGRVTTGTAAVACAVWQVGANGRFESVAQAHLDRIGLTSNDERRQRHDEILRQLVAVGQPLRLPPGPFPHGSSSSASPANPAEWPILAAPIRLDALAGLLEVWLPPDGTAESQVQDLEFVACMADLASGYLRTRQARQLEGRQQLWQGLETFSRDIHGTLDLDEVAYRVANDGKRLIGCDRLGVAVRVGRRVRMVSVSGVDAIQDRSPFVQQMQVLCERVLDWGEKLVYRGVRDDALPVEVQNALDAYLKSSNSRLLAAIPLGDEQEGHPNRSLLLLESFEPGTGPETLVARTEMIGRHAASALANAVDHQRIPLRWLWRPAAWLRDRLEGWAGLVKAAACLGLLALIIVLLMWPYPLKVETTGRLLPRDRRCLFTPVEGQVVRFAPGVRPGCRVAENQSLVQMYDLQLELKVEQLASEIAAAQEEMTVLTRQQHTVTSDSDRLRLGAERSQAEFMRSRKQRELQALRERTNADESQPGHFWLKAPLAGTVLSWDFQENLVHRSVKPSEPILRIGDKSSGWEVELRIPQKQIGRVVRAFPRGDPEAELDVDLVLASLPTKKFQGKLGRAGLAGEALPLPAGGHSSEPVVLASVRIDGPNIAPEQRIPADLLLTEAEVRGQIQCGRHAAGYSLFHGVWEFFCEKVLFTLF